MKKIAIVWLCLFLFLGSAVMSWAQTIEIFGLKKEKVENKDCYFSFFSKLREQLREKSIFFSLSGDHKVYVAERRWLFVDETGRREIWVIAIYLDLEIEPFDWEKISRLESPEIQNEKASQFTEKILKQFKISELLKKGTDL